MMLSLSARDFVKNNPLALEELVDLHWMFFRESCYSKMTWNREKAKDSILSMLMDPDFEVLVCISSQQRIAGFFEFAFESPWMDEEVALCVNFYVPPEFRDGVCSQSLLDLGTKLCQARGAKLSWASSTAGFSDNGRNERAFRMFLKRNGFREVEAFLVREFS